MASFYEFVSLNEEWIRELIAEFLGTFFLVFMGNSAVAEKVLTYDESGNNLTVYIGYSMGLFIGILVSAGISGAHLNPAVTVTWAVARKLRWAKVPHYLFAQYLGAFLAACATYIVYVDSFDAFHVENGVNLTTAGIFTTFPKEDVSVMGSFIDQILGTMVLVIAIYAITDEFNANIPAHLGALYISLVLLGIGCSLGINQGYALNPARDLAPRVFTALTLWGSDVFSMATYWFVPIIGPHIGGILGATLYVSLFERTRTARFEGESSDRNNNAIAVDPQPEYCQKKVVISRPALEKCVVPECVKVQPTSSKETYTSRL